MEIIIWTGLVLGGVYALIATGFTLVQLPTGVFNFAHGAIVVAGAFLTYQFLSVTDIPVGWVVVLDAAIGAVAGVLCELLAVRPLRWARGTVGANAIVTTVGVSTALVGAFGVTWDYDPLRVPFGGPTGDIKLVGILVSPVEIAVIVAAVVVSVALHFWFRLTRRGQACLAVAEDRDAAALRGVNVDRLSLGSFAIAGAFGALAGMLVGPVTYAYPGLATTLALGGFVALALGGAGSFLGGLFGGLLVGLVATFATRYIGANYSEIAVLALLLVTLVVRPRGLGGLAEARGV